MTDKSSPVPHSASGNIETGNIDQLSGVAIGHGALSIMSETSASVGGDVITAQSVTIYDGRKTLARPSKRQAPQPPTTYVPRPALEQALHQLLTQHGQGSVLVQLTGTPGVGKTLLAAHVVHELEVEFPDGTLWADLSKMISSDALSYFVAPFSDVPVSSQSSLAQLEQALAGQRVLIVLDQAATEDYLTD